MALLDVSELMWDPDFVDPFNFTRFSLTVNELGRTVLTPELMSAYGSTQPATERTYELFPDCTRVKGAMELFTTTALTPPTDELAADEVILAKKVYLVQGVVDYGNWGNGYFIALIALKSLLAPEPGDINMQPPVSPV